MVDNVNILKTEYEKMVDHELYDANCQDLCQRRKDARILLKKYNDSGENMEEFRLNILENLFGNISEVIKIEPPFYCDYGCNISVGNNFYMNFDCVILDCAKVTIGDNFMCGPKVQILTPGHPTNAAERIKGLEFAKTITIGNNCWIGGGAILCPGIIIGDNVTIGAGSVVTKDIPSDVVAVGNPCKVIKNLTK